MRDPLRRTPAEFVEWLRSSGRRRVLLHRGAGGGLDARAPELAPLARFASDPAHGYRGHEAVFLEVGSRTGALCAAFVHRTARGQAQGGLRRWGYDSLAELLRDGLRLSWAMGRKNALAGLWWSGGKGILAAGDLADAEARRDAYRDFGAFVTSLRGAYVTAEDVGTTPADLAEVARATRFVTCLPPEQGGSGNPSQHTARGVVCAMETALDFLGMGRLRDKRIAMQGGGAVGAAMIEELLAREVASVVVAELSPDRCRELEQRFAARPVEVRRIETGDASILAEPCDVLAPNGLGAVLGPETIPKLRATLVCGAANGPLVDEARDARALMERGIVYVPDFLANRLGIVHCANEQYGTLPDDPACERQLDPGWTGSIPAMVRRVLEAGRRERIPPLAAAERMAEAEMERPHPVWEHRGAEIIASLVRDGWEDG